MVEVRPTDDVDAAPRVQFVGVAVSEPDDGQGDGHTVGDVPVRPDGRILVRAERSGQGNVGDASATVTVPRSQHRAERPDASAWSADWAPLRFRVPFLVLRAQGQEVADAPRGFDRPSAAPVPAAARTGAPPAP